MKHNNKHPRTKRRQLKSLQAAKLQTCMRQQKLVYSAVTVTVFWQLVTVTVIRSET